MLTVKEFLASYDPDGSDPLECHTSEAIATFDRLKRRLAIKARSIQLKATMVLDTIQKHGDADVKDFVLNTCGEFQEVLPFEMLLAECMQQREAVIGLLQAVGTTRANRKHSLPKISK